MELQELGGGGEEFVELDFRDNSGENWILGAGGMLRRVALHCSKLKLYGESNTNFEKSEIEYELRGEINDTSSSGVNFSDFLDFSWIFKGIMNI